MSEVPGSMAAPLAGALVDEYVARGENPSPLLECMGVSREDLADHERRIQGASFIEAFEIAMRATRDDGFPIAVGRRISVERFGPLGYVLYTSPTIGDALRSLVRHHALMNDTGAWRLEHEGEVVTVTWDRADETLGLRVANETLLASFVTIGVEVIGSHEGLESVHFAHASPRRPASHEAHFAVPLRWRAAENRIVLDARVLLRKPRAGDPLLSSYFGRIVEEALATTVQRDTWTARVARAISTRLASGLPTVEAIARELGTSERTVRRRLSDEGTTFAAVTEQVQRERAARLLSSSHPIRDIAFATGFADVTAFCRAYKRWTGKAPSADRPPKGGRD